ncbi:MAG: UbiA family prenyltransferase [Phycisphaerales bacterium]
MPSTFTTLVPLLRLTRLAVGVGALVNAWFLVLWSRAVPEERMMAPVGVVDVPLWRALFAAALCGLGLYAFAAVLNDVVDRRRDAALHPSRPLPSGRVSLTRAGAMLVVLLTVALVGAAMMGPWSMWMTLGTAGAIVAFNTAGKFVPSAALVMLSLIYGAQMMTPNVYLSFVWPVCLTMTHALAVGALSHRAGERRPLLSKRARVAAIAGWAFWTGVLLVVGHQRGGVWPDWVPWWVGVAPALLAIGFLAFGRAALRRPGPGPARAALIQRVGALWLPAYGSAWLLGIGHLRAGAVLLGVAAAGVTALVLLRGVFDAAENPARFLR